MKREIKFRSWSKERKTMEFWGLWWNYIEYLDESEEIVMQYTGLKDESGKEIYEGDIVRGGHKVYSIQYRQGSFDLMDNEKGASIAFVETEKSLEIIGNIYENKELLTDIK